MKKKILIGSILVLTLLLLMPSIPAIQQKTIEVKVYDDLVKDIKEIDFKDTKVIRKLLNGFWDEHPILGFLLFIAWIRMEWGFILEDFSVWIVGEYSSIIIHPLLYIWSQWLIGTAGVMAFLIQVIAYILFIWNPLLI